MTKDELWQQLTEPWNTFPALAKPIIARGGVCVGTETAINGYVFQFGLIPTNAGTPPGKVISYAKIGDWGNVTVAVKAADLPFG